MSDTAAFSDFVSMLSELEDESFLEGLADELGEKIDELIQNGFRTATAPNGQPWAPRKLARGRTAPPHLPLDRSGSMRGSFHRESSVESIKVTNPVAYTGYQNYGTRYIDARAMLPGSDGLGTWEQPLRDVTQKFMNAKLNEGT